MCEKSVLDPIPHTQHRPICITVNPVIVPHPTTSRRRFNLKRANRDEFSAEFDAAIEKFNSILENYARFIELLCVVFRRHIPRGCRSNYIIGQYSSNPFGEGTLETGTKLIDTMIEQKMNKWEEVITSTDLTHNSRKAWQTIRKLPSDPTSTNPPCLVHANQVAHQLLVNGRGTMATKPKHPVLPTVEGIPSLASAFSEAEYRKGIAVLKYNKAAGIDDVLVEQLNNL